MNSPKVARESACLSSNRIRNSKHSSHEKAPEAQSTTDEDASAHCSSFVVCRLVFTSCALCAFLWLSPDMTVEIQEANPNDAHSAEMAEPLPFPYNQRTYCNYEPIEKSIEQARVLIVDNLLRDEGDLSQVARAEWGKEALNHLKRERQIASLAMQNIVSNIERLVKQPVTRIVHVSQLAEAAADFRPDAIVLSGTLRDFDYYKPELLDDFAGFIRTTRTPVLGICGGHQLIGLSFGARVVTLGRLEQHDQREIRPLEYQYRFVRIIDPADPIFAGIDNPRSE